MQNKNDDTALMLAASRGYEKCVEILCKEGADINMQNRYDDTALTFVRIYEKCVEILKKFS